MNDSANSGVGKGGCISNIDFYEVTVSTINVRVYCYAFCSDIIDDYYD